MTKRFKVGDRVKFIDENGDLVQGSLLANVSWSVNNHPNRQDGDVDFGDNYHVVGAAYQMLKKRKLLGTEQADPNAVMPESDLPQPKQNEWGGTDGLKSPTA